MALAANKRHLQGRDRRPRVLHRIDFVVPMAIHAAGCQRVAVRNGFPVNRAGMLLPLRRVARAAIYVRQWRFVRQLFSFQIGVAARASEAGMNRSGKFLPVHVQRNGLATSHGAHGLVAVAGETLRPRLLGIGPRRAAGASRKQKSENCREERRNVNSQPCTPLPSHNFCFCHVNSRQCLLHVKIRKHFRVFLLYRQ